MKLKVCGMREPLNIKALSALTPDYMGFIFWAPSSRYVETTTPELPSAIKKTGVFVDASVDYIQSMVLQHNLQAVQLHGEETLNIAPLSKTLAWKSSKPFRLKTALISVSWTLMKPAVISSSSIPKGNFPGAMAMDLIGVF